MEEFENLDDEMSTEFDIEMEFEDGPEEATTEATPLEVLPGFDVAAGAKWIYPSNMSFRQYQYDIVSSCLYKNTLVCLPTGLGKTFIAAVVMYNFYRWYPRGKIVFMAPTKPLVAQQIEACFKVMGIPQVDTKEMTGNTHVAERSRAWSSKRVFFLTPQVMSNDLSRGLFPAKEVKLLIVDEAHKAQGDYAYCQVVRELVRAESQTRIVALSATPGSDIPSVRTVLQNLCIAHIELRNEESPDILPYTHKRIVDKIVVPMDQDINSIKQKFLGVLEIYTKKLAMVKAIRKGHNPTTYKRYTLILARDEWRQNPPANIQNHVKGLTEADFATAMRLYHGLELLTNQGLRSFYHFMTREPDAGDRNVKRIKGELGRIPAWRDIEATLAEKFNDDHSNSILNQGPNMTEGDKVVGQEVSTSHPKMDKLLEVVKEHFARFSEQKLETKVIIFSEFRDCVIELVACLSQLKPTVRPMPFIGQAGSGGKKGLTQKEQIEVVRKFKEGGYNTIVATCVAEEGLDIGEVDLIVLYDVAKSPIRLVQRMGRTGRKRDGRIVVLVTEGAEERSYNQSVFKKKSIHDAITYKDKLENAMYLNSPRMVPRGINPQCHQMRMEQKEWECQAGGARQTAITGSFRKTTKYDTFKINCGFLTEIEEERWQKLDKFDGEIKQVQEAREVWSEETPDTLSIINNANMVNQNKFDLSEFSLWQSQTQNRMFVSAGTLSNIYCDVLNLKNNPDLMQNRMRKSKTREKIPSGDGKNSIMNYFRPSQNKSQHAAQVEVIDIEDCDIDGGLEVIEEEKLEEINVETEHNPPVLDFVKHSVTKLPDIAINENHEHMEPQMENEDLLIEELLPEQDSGIHSLCSSPPSLSRLLKNLPSEEDVLRFDLTNAIEIAMNKFGLTENGDKSKLNPKKNELSLFTDSLKDVAILPEPLVTFPAEKSLHQNESLDDMFKDDSLFQGMENTNFDVMNPKEPVEHGMFDIGSPVMDIEVDKNEKEEITIKDQNKNLNGMDSNDDKEQGLFDLGSPIIEAEEDFEAEKISVLNVDDNLERSNFDIGSPDIIEEVKHDDINDIAEPVTFHIPNTHTSTPINTVGTSISLRKSVMKKQTTEIANNLDSSADMFGDDSDDDLFCNVVLDEERKKPTDKSLFSTSQLVSMMNRTNSSSSLKSSASKTKLSAIFDDIPSTIMEQMPTQEPFTRRDLPPRKLSAVFSDMKAEEKVNSLMENRDKPQFTDEDEDLFCDEDSFIFHSQNFERSKNLSIENASSKSENLLNKSSESDIDHLQDVAGPSNVNVNRLEAAEVLREEHECPVCSKKIRGDLNKFNEHLDICLNMGTIKEMTQNENIGNMTDRQMDSSRNVQEDSSPSSSPIVQRTKKTNVLASQSYHQRSHSDDDDITRNDRSISSDDDSRIIMRRTKKMNVLASQSCQERSPYDKDTTTKNRSISSDDELRLVMKKKKKPIKRRGNQFIESEAEISGDDSGDENDESQDHYDESFVDDCTQATDHGVYLRSVKSPEFRKPMSRVLPPITDDIFSQQVEDVDDYYEEDSFCVGDSLVENETHYDTLDLLEQEAENARQNRRPLANVYFNKRERVQGKRKRIITHSSDEETIVKKSYSNVEVEKCKKRKRIMTISSDEESIMNRSEKPDFSPDRSFKSPEKSKSDKINTNLGNNSDNSFSFLSESTIESQKLAVVISGSEVNRSQDLISCLRHEKGLNVLVRRMDLVSLVVGRESAVIRMPEAEISLGTNREKIMKRLKEIKDLYKDVTIIVEWEKVKAGDRPRTSHRTKQQDLTLAQLAVSGVRLLFSSCQMTTADIVKDLADVQDNLDLALPRVNFTNNQEIMVKWLQQLPGVGVGAAYSLSAAFLSLRELVSASRETIMQKGLSSSVADNLVTLFNKSFNKSLTDIAPL